jgi:F-type H+-transporting ATPase subunit c
MGDSQMQYLIGSILAASGTAGPQQWAIFGAAIACGLIIIGSAIGIGVVGARAVDAIARQPEAGGRIFSTMIIVAALIEGVTFFALLICFLALFWEH